MGYSSVCRASGGYAPSLEVAGRASSSLVGESAIVTMLLKKVPHKNKDWDRYLLRTEFGKNKMSICIENFLIYVEYRIA